MTWLAPSAFEKHLFEDTKERWPEIIPVAQAVSLVTRIESLLLRNVRRLFVPQAGVEIESLLWFSPLVAARSSRHIVFHPGAARLLADQLVEATDNEQITEIWKYTQLATRHWSAADRLERDLRYSALFGNEQKIQQGLRDILRRINIEQSEDEKIALARWVKRSLPVIQGPGIRLEEAELLAQFSGLALGDAGRWTQLGQARALPSWLESKLPPPLDAATLGVTIHADARQQVLLFVAPNQSPNSISFPTPLPADIHISAEGQEGQWHTVTTGSRIRVAGPGKRLILVTRDGRQYGLSAEMPVDFDTNIPEKETSIPLYLSHVEADRRQAEQIRNWLNQHGIDIELVSESAGEELDPTDAKGQMIRLWTQNAKKFWEEREGLNLSHSDSSFILRTDTAAPPQTRQSGANRVFDWSQWFELDKSPQAEVLLKKITEWVNLDLHDDLPEPIKEENEIERLLTEIDNQETEPPRRLEIGDRLAELGDPRPGVGVRQIEVAVDDPIPKAVTPDKTSSKIQALIEEIKDVKIQPPRRLEIGDELARLGDPRKGVGLGKNGLPEFDWVEIPAGPFIYQKGKIVELPTFYMSRYPVTNAQFQAFIDAGGYKGKERPSFVEIFQAPKRLKRDWWANLKKPSRKERSGKQFNRPRTNIDWYESVAFCRWLSAMLGLEKDTIRLPTEREWEKTARGVEGLVYPWGNEYQLGTANVDEKRDETGPWNLQQTTAVGMYPHGQSPCGVEDLAGTVWEWCSNKYSDPVTTRPDTSGDGRVLRGGSLFSQADLARSYYRNRYNPVFRGSGVGFRVLSSAPIR